MTDLKYLEEVLPAYRAGKEIYRTNLDVEGKRHKVPAYHKDKFPLGDYHVPGWSIIDKVWAIEKEHVSWPVAWEALKAGKRVKLLGRMWTCARMCGEHVIFTGDPMDVNYDKDRKIPISWLDREDFEVYD